MARDHVLDELLDAAFEDDTSTEVEVGLSPQRGTATRYFVTDHHAVRTIAEMKDLMRATVDLLEMEAARLRHELEVLEMNTSHEYLN